MPVFPDWHNAPKDPVSATVHNEEWDEDIEDGEFQGNSVKLNLPEKTDDGYVVHAKNPQGTVVQIHLLKRKFNAPTGGEVYDLSNERYWYKKIVKLGFNVEKPLGGNEVV